MPHLGSTVGLVSRWQGCEWASPEGGNVEELTPPLLCRVRVKLHVCEDRGLEKVMFFYLSPLPPAVVSS